MKREPVMAGQRQACRARRRPLQGRWSPTSRPRHREDRWGIRILLLLSAGNNGDQRFIICLPDVNCRVRAWLRASTCAIDLSASFSKSWGPCSPITPKRPTDSVSGVRPSLCFDEKVRIGNEQVMFRVQRRAVVDDLANHGKALKFDLHRRPRSDFLGDQTLYGR